MFLCILVFLHTTLIHTFPTESREMGGATVLYAVELLFDRMLVHVVSNLPICALHTSVAAPPSCLDLL